MGRGLGGAAGGGGGGGGGSGRRGSGGGNNGGGLGFFPLLWIGFSHLFIGEFA